MITDPFQALDDPNVTKLEDLNDGSSVYEIDYEKEQKKEEKRHAKFSENIAEVLDDSKLNGLASKLLENIQNDQDSRQDWEACLKKAMEYLGFKVEGFRNYPFASACATYDTTLATALLRFYSVARAELFPSKGPAKLEILGEVTPEREQQGEAVIDFINWYLTVKDKVYYPDSERLLMYVGLFGCAFRKVYTDPQTGKPVARLIHPQDFIIDNNTPSIMGSCRMSQVMELSKKEIMLMERSGQYKKSEVPDINDNLDEDSQVNKAIKTMEGINTQNAPNKSTFKFYETHEDMIIEGIDEALTKDKVPLPYVLTVNSNTKKVVSIRRNWEEGDETFKRKDFFVQYQYLPGFGIYSLGLAHLIGTNAITLTAIQRLSVDAAMLKSFPGGLKAKGLRIETNDKPIGPCEFRDIEVSGPISDSIMLMPYADTSPALLQLRKEIIQETLQLCSANEAQIAENSVNAPVGTTLALLESQTRLQSSILRSLHVSLGNELQLLYKQFAENLEDEPYKFDIAGKERAILPSYFSANIGVVPVSDPDLITSTHRILKAESLLKLASGAPQLHDMREAYNRMYLAMNVHDIKKLLPEPQAPISIDAVTENMIALEGNKIFVDINQDHDAHIISHAAFGLENKANPQVYSSITQHNQKHKAALSLKRAIEDMQKLPQLMSQAQQLQQMIMMQQMQPEQPMNQQVMM